MHVVNQYFGGVTEPTIGDAATDHVATVHSIEVHNDLDGVLTAGSLSVNSFHEQGVTREGVASPLSVFAVSCDGWVEGLVHNDLPILAVQWHPERRNPDAAVDVDLVRRLFRDGAFWRGH